MVSGNDQIAEYHNIGTHKQPSSDETACSGKGESNNENLDLSEYPYRSLNVGAITIKDPDTEALVTMREDLEMITVYPQGETIVEHADNSRVTTVAGNWKVESEYLPTVSGDLCGLTVFPCPGAYCLPLSISLHGPVQHNSAELALTNIFINKSTFLRN